MKILCLSAQSQINVFTGLEFCGILVFVKKTLCLLFKIRDKMDITCFVINRGFLIRIYIYKKNKIHYHLLPQVVHSTILSHIHIHHKIKLQSWPIHLIYLCLCIKSQSLTSQVFYYNVVQFNQKHLFFFPISKQKTSVFKYSLHCFVYHEAHE